MKDQLLGFSSYLSRNHKPLRSCVAPSVGSRYGGLALCRELKYFRRFNPFLSRKEYITPLIICFDPYPGCQPKVSEGVYHGGMIFFLNTFPKKILKNLKLNEKKLKNGTILAPIFLKERLILL